MPHDTFEAPPTDTATAQPDAFAGRIQDYRQTVLTVLQDLQQLHGYARELQLEGSAAQTEAVINRLRQDRFSVAVVGEFNRGKSTLINALLGAEVLPSDVLPCSAAINRVTYGVDKRALMEFQDGAFEEIPFEQLVDYVTKLTAESEERAASLKTAHVFYPSPYCANDVDVIDTPGLNEDSAMTQVTLGVLPSVDAAILVIMATSPMGEFELNFMTNHLLTSDLGQVLLVVNGIDAIRNPADVDRVLRNVEKRIIDKVLEHARVHMPPAELAAFEAKLGDIRAIGVSAIRALDAKLEGDGALLNRSGFPAFEARLQRFLTEERGIIRLYAPIGRIISTAREISDAVNVREAALSLDAARFEEAADEAEKDIARLRSEWLEKRDQLEKAGEDVKVQARLLAGSFLASLKARTFEAIDVLEIEASDLDAGNRDALQGRLRQAMDTVRNDLAIDYQLQLQSIVHRSIEVQAQDLRQFESDLSALMGQIDQRFVSIAEAETPRTAEGLVGALAFMTGMGGMWSGYRVAGWKGAATGAAASAGTAFAAGVVVAAVGAVVTWPLIIGVGIVSIFTGGWLTKVLFRGDRENRFREEAKKIAEREIEQHLGLVSVESQLVAVAFDGYNAFRNEVVQASEATLNDSTHQLRQLRQDYVTRRTSSEAEQKAARLMAQDVEAIVARTKPLLDRIGEKNLAREDA